MAVTAPLDTMVPISDFNNGKSAAAFAKVKDNKPVTVLKNNHPAFFVISPNDYRRNQENNQHVAQLENMLNEIINAEARREALEGEYAFSSSSVDELMEFLDSDE